MSSKTDKAFTKGNSLFLFNVGSFLAVIYLFTTSYSMIYLDGTWLISVIVLIIIWMMLYFFIDKLFKVFFKTETLHWSIKVLLFCIAPYFAFQTFIQILHISTSNEKEVIFTINQRLPSYFDRRCGKGGGVIVSAEGFHEETLCGFDRNIWSDLKSKDEVSILGTMSPYGFHKTIFLEKLR